MSPPQVSYFVFDVESVADGELVSRVRYPGEALSPTDAIARYRSELMDTKGTDFIPYTFQLPISVVIGKVRADFRIDDIVALDEPDFRSHVITEHFWRGWSRYRYPKLVTFNGRSFDLPLMELAAYRYGINTDDWFQESARGFEKPRNRFNSNAHLDLQDLLTNYGASRFSGGLNLAASLLGKPGKMDVQGDMVQDMFDAGNLAAINDYCRCDVLDTFFVFLRTRVLVGQLSLEEEEQIVAETKEWLSERADASTAYQTYLDQWADWDNPWRSPATPESVASTDASKPTAIAEPGAQS